MNQPIDQEPRQSGISGQWLTMACSIAFFRRHSPVIHRTIIDHRQCSSSACLQYLPLLNICVGSTRHVTCSILFPFLPTFGPCCPGFSGAQVAGERKHRISQQIGGEEGMDREFVVHVDGRSACRWWSKGSSNHGITKGVILRLVSTAGDGGHGKERLGVTTAV